MLLHDGPLVGCTGLSAAIMTGCFRIKTPALLDQHLNPLCLALQLCREVVVVAKVASSDFECLLEYL